jgi:hypothetical protein
MSQSAFDPDSFLNAEVQGEMSTKLIPAPVGEYMGIVDDVKARTWQSKDGSSSGVALDVSWSIEDENVKQLVKRDKVVVRQGIMLNLDDSGRISTKEGDNVGLGRLRQALNMNDPSKPFTPSMLVGQMGKVVVTHRMSGEDVFAEIKKVLPANS